MSFPFSSKALSKRFATTGLSLIEVLMSLTLLALTVLPITVLLSQTSQNSKNVYIQSSRSLLLNHLMDTTTPDRATYYNSFNDGAKDTSISDTGQTIPFMRKVDKNNSNTFQKRIYFYIYNNASDSDSSPRYSTALTQTTDEFRIRCGNTSGVIDDSGFYWYGDQAYSSADKEPGYVAGTYTTGNISPLTTDITNTTGNADNEIFKYYREGSGGADIDYNFDVPNGYYTVKLYFAELDSTVTDTTAGTKRRMDIYMEGANYTNGTYFNPWLAAGGTASSYNKGVILAYDVAVSDNVLNIEVRKNSGSDKNARLSGIVVQKRSLL